MSFIDSIKSPKCLTTFPALGGLEAKFENDCLVNSDAFKENCTFPDFLEPNEFFKDGIPHIKMAVKEGIIVSPGTLRGFFNLLVCDACEGLVIRDINPIVKAYNDFNILLLRIAKTRTDYINLSEKPVNLKTRIQQITKNIEQDNTLPNKAAFFYKENIEHLCNVYYKHSSETTLPLGGYHWKDLEDFDVCNYHKCDKLFSMLQKHARSGNIISTIGSINDLKFLKETKISLVDTSNICDYDIIDLQLPNKHSTPRVMWTQIDYNSTIFRSFIHKPLTEEKNTDFDNWFSLMREMMNEMGYSEAKWMTKYLAKYCDHKDAFNTNVGANRSKETLKWLKKYYNEHVIKTTSGKLFNMHHDNIENLLNNASPEDLKELRNHEKMY